MSLISSSQIEKGHEQDWIGELIITLKPEYSLSGRHWYLKPTCFCLKKHQTYKDHRVLLLNPRIKTRNLILNEDLIQTNLQWIHKIATIVRVWLIKLLIFALKAFESLLFRAEFGLCPLQYYNKLCSQAEKEAGAMISSFVLVSDWCSSWMSLARTRTPKKNCQFNYH